MSRVSPASSTRTLEGDTSPCTHPASCSAASVCARSFAIALDAAGESAPRAMRDRSEPPRTYSVARYGRPAIDPSASRLGRPATFTAPRTSASRAIACAARPEARSPRSGRLTTKVRPLRSPSRTASRTSAIALAERRWTRRKSPKIVGSTGDGTRDGVTRKEGRRRARGRVRDPEREARGGHGDEAQAARARWPAGERGRARRDVPVDHRPTGRSAGDPHDPRGARRWDHAHRHRRRLLPRRRRHRPQREGHRESTETEGAGRRRRRDEGRAPPPEGRMDARREPQAPRRSLREEPRSARGRGDRSLPAARAGSLGALRRERRRDRAPPRSRQGEARRLVERVGSRARGGAEDRADRERAESMEPLASRPRARWSALRLRSGQDRVPPVLAVRWSAAARSPSRRMGSSPPKLRSAG